MSMTRTQHFISINSYSTSDHLLQQVHHKLTPVCSWELCGPLLECGRCGAAGKCGHLWTTGYWSCGPFVVVVDVVWVKSGSMKMHPRWCLTMWWTHLLDITPEEIAIIKSIHCRRWDASVSITCDNNLRKSNDQPIVLGQRSRSYLRLWPIIIMDWM